MGDKRIEKMQQQVIDMRQKLDDTREKLSDISVKVYSIRLTQEVEPFHKITLDTIKKDIDTLISKLA